MHSIDWADAENYRNRVVAELFEWCSQHGLSANATQDKLTVELPTVADINLWADSKKRKVFNISDWGPKGVDENEITNLPDVGETLDEGQPPKGDPDAEA